MTVQPLSELTTFRVGGPPRDLVEATTDADLVAAVSAADWAGQPVLLVAGGSNLLVSDDGFPGTAVLVRTTGIDVADAAPGQVRLRIAAGENWDDVVRKAVAHGWSGLEALSGIPGAAGSTPIQNVGAYGQEVAGLIESVRVYDRRAAHTHELTPAQCEFGYRHSAFKADPGRWVVLSVTFLLERSELSAPVRYAELARALGVAQGERAEQAAVRDAVLALRTGKGMVLDDADHDTWSAGSFFTNPILPAAFALPEGAPAFPAGTGPDGEPLVKTSAAWLIDHAGFGKGFGLPGPAGLSTKHVLALTNRGSARAQDILALARTVRDGVRQRYGITLVNEPNLVGLTL